MELLKRLQSPFRDRETAAVVALVLAMAALRLLPHPENITPIGALALFSGAYLPRRIMWGIPLLALLLGDAAYGFYNGLVMLSVYAGFAASTVLGRWLLRGPGRASAERTALAVGAGALAFWVISNFSIWWVFRPHNVAGLVQCYIDGLPYLARSLMGDAGYALLLFGGYRLLRAAPFMRRAPAAAG